MNKAQKHLIALYERHGTLTPEMVVADARAETSPLHDLFEWDVQKASEAHWQDTARQLIRNVRVTIIHEERVLDAPFFVRNPELPGKQQGYVSVTRLRTDVDLARDAVSAECQRAIAAFRRAQAVAAALNVEDDLDGLVMATQALRARVQPEQEATRN